MKIKPKYPILERIIDDETLNDEFSLFFYRLSYFLNKSILEGEYIQNDSSENTTIISNTIQRITFDLQVIHKPTYDPDLLMDFNYFIEYQINTYDLFCEKTKRLYNKENIEYIDKSIYLDSYGPNFKDFKNFIHLLNYNIELAKIDHSFLNDEIILKQLFNLKNSLITLRTRIPAINKYERECDLLKNKFDILLGALKMKCEFLIDKWYARSKTKLIDQNLKHKNLFESNQYIDYENTPTLKEYKNKIIYLYEINGFESTTLLKNCFQEINRKNLTKDNTFKTLTVLELHTLIKYYKDVVKNTEQLKNLILIFDKKTSEDNNNLYETFALHVAKQYCQNNYFSLYSEKLIDNSSNLTSDKLSNNLDAFFSEYKAIKNDTLGHTDNFFLLYKFLISTLTILDNHLKQNKDDIFEAVRKTKVYHEKLQETIEDFEEKILWSLKNNNYIFKLPYNESIVEFKSIKVYFSSSFLLPKIDEDIVAQKRTIDDTNQKLKLIYATEPQLSEISKLKENLKDDNKRIIEIVSIFTAVISFIVGSIGGFKFVTDIYTAISFTISLGLCLMIFLFFIMRFIRKKDYGTFWDFSILFILLSFVAFISLEMHKELKPKTNTTSTESDNIIKPKTNTD